MTVYEIVTSTGARYYSGSNPLTEGKHEHARVAVTVAAGPIFQGEGYGKALPQIEGGEVDMAHFNRAHIVAVIEH